MPGACLNGRWAADFSIRYNRTCVQSAVILEADDRHWDQP